MQLTPLTGTMTLPIGDSFGVSLMQLTPLTGTMTAAPAVRQGDGREMQLTPLTGTMTLVVILRNNASG